MSYIKLEIKKFGLNFYFNISFNISFSIITFHHSLRSIPNFDPEKIPMKTHSISSFNLFPNRSVWTKLCLVSIIAYNISLKSPLTAKERFLKSQHNAKVKVCDWAVYFNKYFVISNLIFKFGFGD